MKRLGKIKALAFGSLAAVALAAPLALAQTGGTTQDQPNQRDGWHKREGGEGRGRGGRGHFDGRGGGFGFFRGVELTEEQQTRLRQIHQSFGERTQGLRQQLRDKQREVREASNGTTFNEGLVSQRLTEAAQLQARLMGEEFKLRQESLSVLTAEQRTQIEQRRAERESRRGERRGGRRGGMQQPPTQIQ